MTTDRQIVEEFGRVWAQQSNGRDCTWFLGPAEQFDTLAGRTDGGAQDNARLADARVRFVVTDGEPALDLEIHETAAAQHIFVRTIGDQAPLNAVPTAVLKNHYALPDRIFVPGDDFKATYDATPVKDGYSLYTDLCIDLRPASIFEIGVRYGYSAWALLRGCAPGTTYHGIDIRAVDIAEAVLRAEFPQHALRLSRCDSGTLTHLSRSYDLAHVDGNHAHEAALHDLELCFTRAKYIVIDDVKSFCTVNSAVNEFLAAHPGLEAVRYDTKLGHLLLGPLPYVR